MGMTRFVSGAWTPAKALFAALAVTLGMATISLVLLLAATPPFECGEDYASPPTPVHSGGVALASLAAGAVGLLVAMGLMIGLPRTDTEQRRWGRDALATAFLVLLVAGGAVFADAARWTCWP
jgi:hypothetical protein